MNRQGDPVGLSLVGPLRPFFFAICDQRRNISYRGPRVGSELASVKKKLDRTTTATSAAIRPLPISAKRFPKRARARSGPQLLPSPAPPQTRTSKQTTHHDAGRLRRPGGSQHRYLSDIELAFHRDAGCLRPHQYVSVTGPTAPPASRFPSPDKLLPDIVVLFPFHIPIYTPRWLYLAFWDSLTRLRITSPRQLNGNGDDPKAESRRFVRLRFPLNFITTPLIADLFLLAIQAIGRREVCEGTLGANSISPIDIMVFFISLA